MSTDTRRPGWLETWGLVAASGLALAVVLLVWASAALVGSNVPANPFAYLVGLLAGRYVWPGLAATLVLAAVVLIVLAVATAILITRLRRRPSPTTARIDQAARLLAGPRELTALTPHGVAESARRLRPTSEIDPATPADHGRLLGHSVVGQLPMRANWEDLGVHIWGPRRGKTTTLTIPMIVEAPGPVLATSNKRDLSDATRDVRARLGRVWIFDPQQVAGETPTWWYDPLSRVTDIRSAEVLAEHFITETRDENTTTDSYFDTDAENLLAAYLLAAARSDSATLTTVYEWLTNSSLKEAQRILREAGDDLVAADVQSIQEAPPKQASGVFSTAKALLASLRDPAVRAWITPPDADDDRPQFVPEKFVASHETVYCLSQEGPGSCGPLVTAITEHVTTAASRRASTQPGGRTDPPLYCALDEAANVVTWRNLPALYSHFGSRGIVVDTILQNWSQGARAWGTDGMKTLWSAATIRTYGGGVVENEFLHSLATLGDQYEEETWSVSYDRGRRTHSASGRPKDILTTGLLAAIPPGRALALAAGAAPFILRPVPWWEHTDHADAIRTSLAAHDPGGGQ